MFLHEVDIVGQILEYLTTCCAYTMLIKLEGEGEVRRDAEENSLTNPFKAPWVFLAQKPAAFAHLSVSRPWSRSEMYYMMVMHHLLAQLHYKEAYIVCFTNTLS